MGWDELGILVVLLYWGDEGRRLNIILYNPSTRKRDVGWDTSFGPLSIIIASGVVVVTLGLQSFNIQTVIIH